MSLLLLAYRRASNAEWGALLRGGATGAVAEVVTRLRIIWRGFTSLQIFLRDEARMASSAMGKLAKRPQRMLVSESESKAGQARA